MSDDIVTRLRDECWTIHGTKFHRIIGCVVCEAADEIERLRNQFRQLEAERDQWQTKAVSHD